MNHLSDALALHQAGKIESAIDAYQRLLKGNKRDPYLLFLLGTAYSQSGNYGNGIRMLKDSLATCPNPIAYNNLGIAYSKSNKNADAIAAFTSAIELDPKYAEGFCNLSAAQRMVGKLQAALHSADQATLIQPDFAAGWNNRGNVLYDLRRFDEALLNYEKAIQLKPNDPELYRHHGDALREVGKMEEALSSYGLSIRLDKSYVEAYTNRGNVLWRLKRLDEALLCYESALLLNPSIENLHGTILSIKMHLCKWENFEKDLGIVLEKIKNHELVASPFPLVGLIDKPRLHKCASEMQVEKKFGKLLPVFAVQSKNVVGDKLKVGYFSADFHDHATMHLMADLFEAHNKSQFDFFAFSYGPVTNDPWQLRAKSAFGKNFYECRNLSDEEIAALSRHLSVDIAIDLKGWTQNGRMGIFSKRAAPIQVNYLGYPGTSGADFIEYLIADANLVPEGARDYYTEKIAYLNCGYQPNCREKKVSEKKYKRSDFGLSDSAFVFCSFNDNYKITPEIYASWLRILLAVDDSVLWILVTNQTAQNNLLDSALKFGVDASRIIFANKLSNDEHLSRIALGDLMLDTYPCGAHTTCSDALRMGLPLLTLRGRSFASQVAASLLMTAGCPELIANSFSEYEYLAIDLARNRDKLDQIRNGLRKIKDRSLLFNPNLFARRLEALYQTMHERHASGLPVDHIL